MKHLISREDYINEYLHVSKNIESNNELNEGLIGTLFGGLKMLLKKDWANIKCKNTSVLNHLKEIDKSLGGYTMTKMQFSGECNTIRQNIADYFNDILDYKLGMIEKEEKADEFLKKENEEKEDSKEEGVAKKLNLKDKTLLDSINKYKENISIACKPSPKLREYADIMLNSIETFVNDIVLAELEKKGLEKEKIEEEKKKNEEMRKKMEEEQKKKNEESKKAELEMMKKLEKDRDDAIRNLGVKPIGSMDGDKAIDTITKQYSDMLGELKGQKQLNESALPQDYADLLKSDTYVGISKSLEELNWDTDNKEDMIYNKFTIRVILNKINTAFNVISENKIKKLFKGVPSASVQAMMISLSNAILYGFVGDKFKIKNDDARLSLMTKCVIDSDATIGFNLPLIDPKKPDNGNYFVSIMNQFRSADISSQEVDDAIDMMSKKELEDIKSIWGGDKDESSKEMSISEFAKEFGPDLMKAFRQNISNLFDMIVSKSKQIKEDAQKARESEAEKAQQESESNDKK